jgi:plasmid maintenance system antidote protein VapI
MPYLANVSRDRQRVWAFDMIRSELIARQDQSHRAIAKHLGLPRKMVNEMCERIVRYSHCPCPHPPK